MEKILGLKVVANIVLAIMLICGFVYAAGFGICLYLARQEIDVETNKKIESGIDYIHCYIDDQLQRVEDATYSLASRNFGKTIRYADGSGHVEIDAKHFVKPTEEECYSIMEQFLEANPMICGIAIGFEKGVYPEAKGEFGFAPYVTRLAGKFKRLDLAELHDYHEWEWYRETAKRKKGYWCSPFRESSTNSVITCYNVPVHGYGDRLVGVLALDIDTKAFSKICSEIAPVNGAVVTLTDQQFRFIAHPDTSYLLKQIKDIQSYADYKADDSMKIKMEAGESGEYTINAGEANEALFYFSPIKRANWTIAIECPKKEIYGNVDRMKRDTTFIAILSIIVMIVCFIFMFRHMQKITMGKANMESELKIAAGIQMGMIPKEYPAFPNRKDLDVCGFLKPAKSIGGDLYDYFIRDEKLFFCIGDVSGKGVPASLFMAVVRSLFRVIGSHTQNPADIADALNTSLSQGNIHNMFCTMFIGVLDLNNGHLDYCNAGHNAPIIRRIEDNEIKVSYATPKTNLAVGVFEGFPFEKEELTLASGEAIFLYTDGVTEAENPSAQLFGEEATLQALADARSHNVRASKDFIDHVYHKIQLHVKNAEQSDDITMLVVEYKG